MEVNNREWSLVILVCTAAALVLIVPSLRAAFRPALSAFAHRKVLTSIGLLLAYTLAVIMGLNQLGVWDAKLITPTIVWFITVALVSLFRLRRAQTEPHFFRNLAFGAIAAPVAVQFVLDMYPFELATELVLQAGFVVLGILSGFSAGNPEYHRAHQVFNAMIVFLVLVVALHSALEITAQWSRIDFLMEARKFALPIGMTAAFLPFMYAFTLYATYETAAFRMRATVPAGTSVWKPALALALRTGLNLPKLNGVTPRTRFDMARATTVAGALKAFDDGQAAEAARLQEEADKKQRLVDNAGLQGKDDAGKQLDQREFAETRNALSYLHLCHAGHYRQRGRYRDDMLDVLGADTFAKKGLPEGAVITMHVADDGQQWWAWRRTVTGWVFAIGANEAPNDRWEYDGPDVPSGGPGTDPGWRHFLVPAEPHEHW